MDTFAIFVDAGYVFGAANADYNSGVRLKYESLIRLIENVCVNACVGRLLRIYWYDATDGGVMRPQHEALAHNSGIKVKLGQLVNGQQKGVDVMLAVDIVTMVQQGLITDAFVITGDSDFCYAFDKAQELGARVHLINFIDEDGRVLNVSNKLAWVSDQSHVININSIERFDVSQRKVTA